MPSTPHIPLCQLPPTASAGQQLLRPLCPSRTFGPGEKQLVGSIQAEHRLGVSFCHRDALQRGCPGILGPSHWVNDAPCMGKKEQAWWSVCAKTLRYTVPGARESKSCLTPSIFHCLAVRWVTPPEPGMSEQRSLWEPWESPQEQPLPAASAPATWTEKGRLPSGLCSPAEPLTPGQHALKHLGDSAHRSSGQSGTNCSFSSLKLCWDKCFRVPMSSTPVLWRLSACGW